MFLKITDLDTVILTEERIEITRNDETVVIAMLKVAEQEMRTYLADSYDVDAIFSAVDDDRDAMLVKLGADIAAYHLVGRDQAGQDNEDRRRRYDRSIAWLKAANKSERYSDLPKLETPDNSEIIHGSNRKRNNYY